MVCRSSVKAVRLGRRTLQLPIFCFRLYISSARRGGTLMELWSRRKFFLTSLASSFAASTGKLFARSLPGDAAGLPSGAELASAPGKRPIIISSANGLHALDKGMDILKKGGDTLDAVVATVTVVEDDPNDDSVGYGGLPNEEGEVELDASVMHGPTHRAGAVAAVRRIKNVSRLAKTVMESTNHTMIVGDGALRFAVAQGFEEMNLLTEHSRKIWLAWKAKSSLNWRPGIDSPEWKEHMAMLFDGDERQIAYAERVIAHPPTGTIPCMAVDAKGDISATTTTSGLSWKIPGRVGDSPIIGESPTRPGIFQERPEVVVVAEMSPLASTAMQGIVPVGGCAMTRSA